MEPTRKLAYFYLATLIATLVSVSLPQPIYTAIIISMNIGLAVVLTAERSHSRLSNILLYFLIVTTIFFNAWALYQTLSFFNPDPQEILTLTIYFLLYYTVSYFILSPENIVRKISKYIPNISFKKPEKPSSKDILDGDHINRMLRYKKSANESLDAKFGNSSVGSFAIVSQEDASIIVKADNELESFIKEKPTEVVDIELLMPTATFSFKTSFSSLSPATINIPTHLTHIEDLENFRESFRINEPKSITAAIDANGKKMEVHVKNISATGALLDIHSKALIEYMDNINDYFELILSISGTLISITSSSINKTNVGENVEHGIEFKNLNEPDQRKLQETIFKELNI